MKKSVLTKILAAALSLILLILPSAVTFAAADAQSCPVITVHGLMAEDIYAEPENPDSEVLWPPSGDDIISVVKDCIPSLTKFFATWNWDALGAEISPVIKGLLGPVSCSSDGTVADGSGVRFSYPDPDSVTKNGTYAFKYDWRVDPFISAAQLNDFVNFILEQSGAEKVSIICHSLGGVITLTYLSVYGNQKIQGVCFNATAVYGETYTGELMNGKLTLNADAVTEYMKYAFDESEYKYILNGIFEALNTAGILDLACKFGNLVTEKLFDYAVPEIVVPLFGNWLTIWAMVPDCDIEGGIDYVFNTVYKDSGVERSVIISKIQSYNTLVRANREKTLLSLEENANVVVMSRYGYSSLPITPSWQNLGDGIIDVKYSSFGATAAEYGGMLDDEYLSGKDASFINPMKNIDASTCLFPDKTWFIRDMRHGDTPDSLIEIMKTLLFTENEATVDTYEQYPRFLKYEAADESFSADFDAPHTLSDFDRLILKIKEFFKLIKNLFASVFGK